MTIIDNLESIKTRINHACNKSNRNPDEIQILAATKTRSIEEIRQAVEYGIKIIGENRVQEAERKFMELPQIEKHMIGHLQTNKVKRALKLFDCIQSVDSIKLAREINRRALDSGKIMRVFFEVNIGGEGSKFGITEQEAESFYDKLLKLTNLRVEGIMSILPYVEPEQTRPYLKQLFKIFKNLNLKYLSAGMSNDYVIAVEEGANMLRLGTAIFGQV